MDTLFHPGELLEFTSMYVTNSLLQFERGTRVTVIRQHVSYTWVMIATGTNARLKSVDLVHHTKKVDPLTQLAIVAE